MSNKKMESIISLIDVVENNIKTIKVLLGQVSPTGSVSSTTITSKPKSPGMRSVEEQNAMEVVEGYFDGENMIGDNSQTYIVPQNYASKTQLVIGDRMKWILTPEREVFKLIQPAPRERVVGTFAIEGDNYLIFVDGIASPVKILKASATYAMKNLGLQVGDEVAILVPKEVTPIWGAFVSLVKPGADGLLNNSPKREIKIDSLNEDTENTNNKEDLETLDEFKLGADILDSDKDFF